MTRDPDSGPDAAPSAELPLREAPTPTPGQTDDVRVLSCINCDGPVASSASKCFACGSPLTGKEFAYIHKQPAGPDIAGMIRWWAILSVVVFALGGFSFGTGSMLAFSGISLVYGVRVLRAYFL